MDTIEGYLKKIDKPGYTRYLRSLEHGDIVYLKYLNESEQAPPMNKGKVLSVKSRIIAIDYKVDSDTTVTLQFHKHGRLKGIENANCLFHDARWDLRFRFCIVIPE